MPSMACVLRAACALPVVALNLDTTAFIQGGSTIQRDLPKQIGDTYVNMHKMAEVAKKQVPEAMKSVGDVAFTSGVLAARLPDNMPSEAWGDDKVKSFSLSGASKDGVNVGGFLSGGSDAKQQAHVLAGLGWGGLDEDNKMHLPAAYGGLVGASASPGKFTVVGAVPAGDGLAYGKLDAEVEDGHISPEQVRSYLKAYEPLTKVVHQVSHAGPLPEAETQPEEVAPVKTEQAKQEPAQAPAAAVEEPRQEAKPAAVEAAPVKAEEPKVEATPAPASAAPKNTLEDMMDQLKGRQQQAIAEATPQAAEVAPVKAEEPKVEATPPAAEVAPVKAEEPKVEAVPEAAAAAPVKPEEPQAEAEPAKEALSPEQEAKNKEMAEYELKLMFLDFPLESAAWWAMMRAWANEPSHQLQADEEARHLAFLEGQWQVEKDVEFPKSEGTHMLIKDGKLLSQEGQPLMKTSFKAYVDGKYAGVTPLTSNLDNSTVYLYKICHVEEGRLLFEGGNVWKRVSAATTPKPAAPFAAPAALAWQLPQASQQQMDQMKAFGGDLLKKLGASFRNSAGNEQAKKAADAASGWMRAAQALFNKQPHQ